MDCPGWVERATCPSRAATRRTEWMPLSIPLGQWPNGTGRLPVLPFSTSEFGLTRLALRRCEHSPRDLITNNPSKPVRPAHLPSLWRHSDYPSLTGRRNLLLDSILGLRAKRFTPGCHMMGFQPLPHSESESLRIKAPPAIPLKTAKNRSDRHKSFSYSILQIRICRSYGA
jgi:hypothetical protein